VSNMLAEYCSQGLLEPHIEGLRALYSERRDAMLDSLALHMPPGTSWTRPGGGFFVWLGLPPPLRAAEVAGRARDVRLLIPVGDPFFAEEPAGQYLRLAFSYVTPAKIRDGIAILGQVLGEMMADN